MKKLLLCLLCFLGAWVYAARDASFTWSEYVTIPLAATGSVRISPFARDSAANGTLLVDGEAAVGWTRSNPMWNSRSVADGWHELTLTGENVTARILVINAKEVVVHTGMLTGTETWRANVAHLVCDSVVVPNGKTLTVAEDTDVYYMGRGRILVFGKMETVVTSEPIRLNCAEMEHEGTLTTNEVWGADKVHVVRHLVNIPAGRKLTIADGATVRFCENTGFRVDGTVIYGNGLHFILDDTAIAANAFNGNTGLSRVTLSNGLTSIGANAFACANLEVMVMECEDPPTVSGNLCPGGSPLLLVPETAAWAAAIGNDWTFHGAEVAYQSGMFAYRVASNGSAEIINYFGTETAPVFPNEINGHPVRIESIKLERGWNFVTANKHWDEKSMALLQSYRIFTFDAENRCYVKVLGAVVAGMPLWIYCHDPAELKMFGKPASAVWTLGLTAGWNCVGAAKDVPTLPAKATAWEWTQGRYALVTGGLKAGKAYWVFVE